MNLKKVIYKTLLFEKKNIKLMGYPLHNNEEIEPFFIVGSGRSGNTLLRRILNSHSELSIPPETYMLGKSIKQFISYPFLEWSHMVHLIYSNFQFHPEFETFKMEHLDELVLSVSNVKKKSRSLAYILDGFYRQYAKEHNIQSKRWGDKTPLNTFCINELSIVFPRAKFIHIIRDPYDSIVSYVKSGIYKNIEDATERWVHSLEQAMKYGANHPNKYLEVYYEDLVSDPIHNTKKICDFLNISFEDTMIEIDETVNNLGDVSMRKHHLNVTKPINTNSIGKGKKSLKKNEITIINKIISSSKSQELLKYFEGKKV